MRASKLRRAEQRPDESACPAGPRESNGSTLTDVSRAAYDPPAERAENGNPELMASFGESLRRERELRGVTLREVSEATKINVRYLEALERNEFDHLPGGVFIKGFIKSYARYIGVDDSEMINAYEFELKQRKSEQAEAGSSASVDRLREYHRLPERNESLRRRRARVLVVLTAGLLLVAIAAGAVWGARALMARSESGGIELPWGSRSP
jgi:cytoskeletal protein RodZ